MKLYHGTTRAAVDSILAHGIEPRGKRRRRSNWKHSVESNPDCVYLTNCYPLHFSLSAGKDLSDLAIIEVETAGLNQARLIPDEDAIEQSNRGSDGLPATWDMKRRTRHYRKQMVNYNNGEFEASLRALGTCCYRGTIEPEAITRVCRLDLTQNSAVRWAFDPMICLANHHIMGGFYRQYTRWLFGDEIDFDDVGPLMLAARADLFTRLTRTGIEVAEVGVAEIA